LVVAQQANACIRENALQGARARAGQIEPIKFSSLPRRKKRRQVRGLPWYNGRNGCIVRAVGNAIAIMGGDAPLATAPAWHKPREILEAGRDP